MRQILACLIGQFQRRVKFSQEFFFKMDHSRSLFHLFSSFLSTEQFSINRKIQQPARFELGLQEQEARTLTTRPPPRPKPQPRRRNFFKGMGLLSSWGHPKLQIQIYLIKYIQYHHSKIKLTVDHFWLINYLFLPFPHLWTNTWCNEVMPQLSVTNSVQSQGCFETNHFRYFFVTKLIDEKCFYSPPIKLTRLDSVGFSWRNLHKACRISGSIKRNGLTKAVIAPHSNNLSHKLKMGFRAAKYSSQLNNSNYCLKSLLVACS